MGPVSIDHRTDKGTLGSLSLCHWFPSYAKPITLATFKRGLRNLDVKCLESFAGKRITMSCDDLM